MCCMYGVLYVVCMSMYGCVLYVLFVLYVLYV